MEYDLFVGSANSLKNLQIFPHSMSDADIRKRQGRKGHKRLDKPDKIELDFKEIEKKIRKKQGGRGHGSLSKIAKTKIILSELEHIRLCSSQVSFHHGHYMAEITRFFSSIDHSGTSKMIQELMDTGNITVVCHTKLRGRIYGEKLFYYLTDKGERTFQSYAASGLN